MVYLIITVISFVMGFKIGSLYHILKITSFKREMDKQTIEDTIKKKYEKELYKSNIYIEKLENELNELKEVKQID